MTLLYIMTSMITILCGPWPWLWNTEAIALASGSGTSLQRLWAMISHKHLGHKSSLSHHCIIGHCQYQVLCHDSV